MGEGCARVGQERGEVGGGAEHEDEECALMYREAYATHREHTHQSVFALVPMRLSNIHTHTHTHTNSHTHTHADARGC
jgi:hypothetical protein